MRLSSSLLLLIVPSSSIVPPLKLANIGSVRARRIIHILSEPMSSGEFSQTVRDVGTFLESAQESVDAGTVSRRRHNASLGSFWRGTSREAERDMGLSCNIGINGVGHSFFGAMIFLVRR